MILPILPPWLYLSLHVSLSSWLSIPLPLSPHLSLLDLAPFLSMFSIVGEPFPLPVCQVVFILQSITYPGVSSFTVHFQVFPVFKWYYTFMLSPWLTIISSTYLICIHTLLQCLVECQIQEKPLKICIDWLVKDQSANFREKEVSELTIILANVFSILIMC